MHALYLNCVKLSLLLFIIITSKGLVKSAESALEALHGLDELWVWRSLFSNVAICYQTP